MFRYQWDVGAAEWYAYIRAAAGIAILLAVFAYLFTHHTNARMDALLRCFPEESVVDASLSADPDCLKRTVHTLSGVFSTKELLAYTIETTSPETIVNDCHEIGHIIGEETYRNSSSLENALAKCSNACRGACTHGVVGEAVIADIGQEFPDEDLAHASGKTLERLAREYCVADKPLCHAVGHILFAAFQDYPKALAACDSIGASDEKKIRKEFCYEGVFMESIGKGFSLALGSTTTASFGSYAAPCDGIGMQYKYACLRYLPDFQEIRFASEKITDANTRLQISNAVCETYSGRTRADCIEGIGFFVSPGGPFNADKRAVCDGYRTKDDHAACTLGAVLRLVNNDQLLDATRYCENEERSRAAFCYYAAFQFMEQKSKPPVLSDSCTGSAQCAAMLTEYEKIRSTLPSYIFGLYGYYQGR